jgi:diguanylate cyclase (GGDEF)-like protein
LKLKFKATALMSIFGALIVLVLSLSAYMQNYHVVLDTETKELENISQELALHLDSHLHEKVNLALTLSSAPIIKDALVKSNQEYKALDEDTRRKKINTLDKKWQSITNKDDDFIKHYTDNHISKYFKYQQKILPNMYGEIFLTNRYGSVVAATAKLTTFSHAHKYWWRASYNDGKGKIFFDDRGYDDSAEGYVLGIVIPIIQDKQIIGILKCNVNIIGPLTDFVQNYHLRQDGDMKIVRTGGLVVIGKGVMPLSEKEDDRIVKKLRDKSVGAIFSDAQNNKSTISAFAPIPSTINSDKYGFGGSYESIDHVLGNKGESWHIVVTKSEDSIIQNLENSTKWIIEVGIIFTILSSIIAYFFSKYATEPIEKLRETAEEIGSGNLDVKSDIVSNDEIGCLSNSINKMTSNLKETMASKNDLQLEIERRIKAEEELKILAITDELTGAYNRRAFNDFIKAGISRAKRYKESLALMMIDIDYFKNVNDNFGHDAGDEVLKTLVTLIINSIREEDIIARWGGEEFVVMLPQTDGDAALNLAHRLREYVSAFKFEKSDYITISIGFSKLREDDDMEKFLKRVDDALYRAKEEGRDRVVSIL